MKVYKIQYGAMDSMGNIQFPRECLVVAQSANIAWDIVEAEQKKISSGNNIHLESVNLAIPGSVLYIQQGGPSAVQTHSFH